MTRKILIALVFMALLFCPAVVSAGSSDICFSLGDSEEGRYVFLFQKDGFVFCKIEMAKNANRNPHYCK